MDAKDYLQRQISTVRYVVDATLKDTTDDQFNWTPPGLANSIRVTLLHMLTAEDGQVQGMLQGQLTLWQSGDWGKKLGLTNSPSHDEAWWNEIKTTELPLADVLGYAGLVYEATNDYLAGLSADDFDQAILFFGQERTLADALTFLVTHVAGHAGEIAAVKGMQGVKGLPF